MMGVAESRNESVKAKGCCIAPLNPPILGDFEVVRFPPEIGGLGGPNHTANQQRQIMSFRPEGGISDGYIPLLQIPRSFPRKWESIRGQDVLSGFPSARE